MYIEGPEYGSMKIALKSCMDSVDRLAECHIAVKDRLLNVVQARVKEWKNEHYKKSLMGGCREAKAFEEDFRKVCCCYGHRHLSLYSCTFCCSVVHICKVMNSCVVITVIFYTSVTLPGMLR